MQEYYEHLHRAPTLYDSRRKGLFWVVKKVWPQSVDCLAEVEIWATYDLRGGHSFTDGLQDLADTCVVQLALEETKGLGILVFLVR